MAQTTSLEQGTFQLAVYCANFTCVASFPDNLPVLANHQYIVTATLISTDEAGYGPNLGPLMIAGTLWTVDDPDTDLYLQLGSGVANKFDSSGNRLFIADSKLVHRAGNLRSLEQNVLSVLHSMTGRIPDSLKSLLELVSLGQGAQTQNGLEQQVWLKDAEIGIPAIADLETIDRLSDLFSKTCQTAKVKLHQVVCESVFADEFNRQINVVRNKANLLSDRSLQLVRVLLDAADSTQPVQIGCDKHGGRSKYAALIQHHLRPDFVKVRREQLELSEYEFPDSGRNVKIWFAARGESFLPTALSSMFAKYVREILMIAWNSFWQRSVSNLKPTQGYPQDAKRFIREIEPARQKLGIPRETIWRER